ncbi:MAG: hypothetical protein CTY25_15320 [Methylobacterium sp.]|nr:MAG: hypothetical protein CTY25_15320 [Methylobacterium sp.]
MEKMAHLEQLVLALVAQLRAERETRHALAFAIRHGVVDREVLLAILEDPIPATAIDALALADRLGEGGAADPVRFS